MAFWNTRDDDEAAETTAEELEAAAVGAPLSRPAEEPRGFYASPMGLIAAAVVLLLVAAFFFAPGYGYRTGLFNQAEPWVPRGGEAVYASQRLADIAAQQRVADLRAAAWEDVPAVDAHVGTFAAQTPPR